VFISNLLESDMFMLVLYLKTFFTPFSLSFSVLWILFCNAVIIVIIVLDRYFSFNMAHCYPDHAGDVDVISDSEVIHYTKSILS